MTDMVNSELGHAEEALGGGRFVRAVVLGGSIRPKRLALSHKNVFFSMSTSTPMSQQTFSKFAAKAFVAITGCEVNLQTIRRIVSEGTCISFASPRCIPAAQHI